MVFYRAILPAILAIGTLGLHAAPSASGAEADESLIRAWKAFTRLQKATASYGQRTEIENRIRLLINHRAGLETQHRAMNAQIARFHPRRERWNSEEHAFYNRTVAVSEEINATTQQIAELRAIEGNLDEMDLIDGEADGDRPRAGHRRNLLPEVQKLQRETRAAFEDLRDATTGWSNADLVKAVRGVSEAERLQEGLAPPPAFIEGYRQFLRSNGVTQAPKPKPRRRGF